MASELKTIVDGLNDEPFKMNLNIISFDTISSGQLLQILSDVLLWMESANSIDIREEGADETALRIFNSLRVLKYRPPTDIEQLQEWRRGIVEGEKTAIYPILEWIFKNVDALKERAYLAKYLTKIDVPGAFQDPEVAELSNQISNLMEEFKDVHSQVVEARKDSLLVEDIRSDLKAMELEKEELNRRIEKIERKLRGIANIERFLQLAEQCRLENERLEQVGRLRMEQRNAIVFSDQKLQRLNVTLKEVRTAGENIDPTERMEALKEEMETNRYMVSEKLPKEIGAKMAIVADLNKVADVAAIDTNDIAELQQKIEKINQEIMDLVNKRDRKDESIDKLSIYRHQASAVNRKKAALVEKLQEARSELQSIENAVEEKKNELKEKARTDFVITSVQFKNYVSKLRAKTYSYKRKRAEIDDLKSEQSILTRTADILTNQWKTLKQRIEESGSKIIETAEASHIERSKTAKPETDDVRELRDMINELNEQVDLKRTVISELGQSNNELNEQLADVSERFNLKKRNYETAEASLESAFAQLQQDVKNMEERMSTNRRKIFRAEIELKVTNTFLEKLEQEENAQRPRLVNQIEEEINRVNKEAESLQRPKQGNGNALSTEEAAAQVAMWRSLMKIFQVKLQTAQTGNRNGMQDPGLANDAPIGDRRPNGTRGRLVSGRSSTSANTRRLQKDITSESSGPSTADSQSTYHR